MPHSVMEFAVSVKKKIALNDKKLPIPLLFGLTTPYRTGFLKDNPVQLFHVLSRESVILP